MGGEFYTLKHFFIVPTDAHNYKITGMLKTIKIPIIAPTCFGSRRNHHQGAISYLAKTTTMILFVVNDVVNVKMAYQPVCKGAVPGRGRLICRHDIDHIINDEHNIIIIVVLAKHEIAH